MGRSITKASKKMKYLSPDDIVFIHDEVLRRYGGGEPGIYPNGLGKVESTLNRMSTDYFGHQPFETLIQKTAFLFQSLLIYHPFLDGMKRTGIFSSLAFLLKNDHLFVSKGVKDSVDFAIHVADDMVNLDPDDSLKIVTEWFGARVISLQNEAAILEHVASKGEHFKCPRCANDRMTVHDPKCHDCGLLLTRYNLTIDGIVLKRNIVLNISTHK